MQIRTKITTYFVLITASLLLTAFILIFYLYQDVRTKEFYRILKSRAITSANLLINFNENQNEILKRIEKSKKDVLTFEKISIYDYQDNRIYTNTDFIDFNNLLDNKKAFLRLIKIKNQHVESKGKLFIIGFKYRYKSRSFILLASAKDTFGLHNSNNLIKVLALVFVIIVSLLGFFGWLFSKRVTAPMLDVIKEVDEISDLNLNKRLAPTGNNDEIGHLVKTFNNLLERIELAFKAQKDFTLNVAHELRNPLTVILSQLEITLMKSRSEEEYRATCISLLEDINRVNEIVEQLLLLTNLSNPQKSNFFERCRIDEVLLDVRSSFLKQNPSAKIKIDFSDMPEEDDVLFHEINVSLIKTCFWNLIENAIKYSMNQHMTIRLNVNRKQTIIRFINDGIQISSDELPYIFTPFYRGKEQSKQKGLGLGLSIVKQITDLFEVQIQYVKRIDMMNEFQLIFSKK